MKARAIKIFFFVVIFLSIHSDVFDFNHKDTFTPGMEAWCLTRLALSEQKGIFAESGFLIRPKPKATQIENSQRAYFDNMVLDNYWPYLSYSAVQMTFLGVLDKVLPFDKRKKISIYYILITLISTIVYFSIVSITFKRLGFISTFILLIFLINSEWLMISSYQMAWMFGVFFIPPILSYHYLSSEGYLKDKFLKFAIFLFLSIVLKILTSGFTYITSYLMSIFIPFIFYSIYRFESLRKEFLRYLKTSLVAVASTIFGALLLMLQIAHYWGSLEKGIHHVRKKFIVRTGRFNAEEIKNSAILETLKYDFGDVMTMYLNLPAFRINSVNVPFKQVFMVFIVSLGIMLLLTLIKRIISMKVFLSALGTFIFAFIASISWFYIFHSHSYEHRFDLVAWYMGFMIIGFIIVAFTIATVINLIASYVLRK